MSTFWKVQMLFGGDGMPRWDDAEWTEDGQPVRYPSKKAALEEIRDHVKSCRYAVASGNMESAPHMKDFRAVRNYQV